MRPLAAYVYLLRAECLLVILTHQISTRAINNVDHFCRAKETCSDINSLVMGTLALASWFLQNGEEKRALLLSRLCQDILEHHFGHVRSLCTDQLHGLRTRIA